ncbi:MAG: hypothetical protein M1835_001334 [Candelina submexicana]|nr:MAG: hypothetical protein M1835_001334 [Candelina submexicana]
MANEFEDADLPEVAINSPLLRLSGELRMKIYRYILTAPEVFTVQRGPKLAKLKDNTINPRLLRTCRQIHKESVFILYRENVLHFENTSAALGMCMTANRLLLAAVASVVLPIGYDTHGHRIAPLLRHYGLGLRLMILHIGCGVSVWYEALSGIIDVPGYQTWQLKRPYGFEGLQDIVVIGLEEEGVGQLIKEEILERLNAMRRANNVRLHQAGSLQQAVMGLWKGLG